MQDQPSHSLWHSRIRPCLSFVKQRMLIPVNLVRQLSLRPISWLHGGPDAAIGKLHQLFELTPETVLAGYARGTFATGEPNGRVVWHTPPVRGVIACDQVHISRRLKGYLRKERFQITFDTNFDEVIRGCADRSQTWITPEIFTVYRQLFDMGFAHSVEAMVDGQLVGGGYGVALGRMFFLESMFCREDQASKIAFVKLAEKLRQDGFLWIDCQFLTEHWRRFGAQPMDRTEFLACTVSHLHDPARFSQRGKLPLVNVPASGLPVVPTTHC